MPVASLSDFVTKACGQRQPRGFPTMRHRIDNFTHLWTACNRPQIGGRVVKRRRHGRLRFHSGWVIRCPAIEALLWSSRNAQFRLTNKRDKVIKLKSTQGWSPFDRMVQEKLE